VKQDESPHSNTTMMVQTIMEDCRQRGNQVVCREKDKVGGFGEAWNLKAITNG
jgi:hypothetical protein